MLVGIDEIGVQLCAAATLAAKEAKVTVAKWASFIVMILEILNRSRRGCAACSSETKFDGRLRQVQKILGHGEVRREKAF
jgi:hypothetical protein